ncbi:MAG: D-glycero-beta-D-manno-heptose 1,7-bisphosphate 7-phosphatase [Pseudomonadota bacterium]
MQTNKLVILDRDGVINIDHLGRYVTCPEEWQPIPGSIEAMAQLNQLGFRIAVASNQAGIAKGLYSQEELQAIHAKMQRVCHQHNAVIDYITYCPHRNEDHCACRKPQPGMLLEIARHFHTDLQQVVFVGDKLTDMQAAENAGCIPIMVLTGHGESELAKYQLQLQHIKIYENLERYVASIIPK